VEGSLAVDCGREVDADNDSDSTSKSHSEILHITAGQSSARRGR